MQPTLFERIGEDNIRTLVDEFYDLVFVHPQISHLFKTDKELIKEKQRMFLTQFFGGPPLYSQRYGHPQLRARHLPHPIGEDDAVAWLFLYVESGWYASGSRRIKGRTFSTLHPDGNVYGQPGGDGPIMD